MSNNAIAEIMSRSSLHTDANGLVAISVVDPSTDTISEITELAGTPVSIRAPPLDVS